MLDYNILYEQIKNSQPTNNKKLEDKIKELELTKQYSENLAEVKLKQVQDEYEKKIAEFQLKIDNRESSLKDKIKEVSVLLDSIVELDHDDDEEEEEEEEKEYICEMTSLIQDIEHNCDIKRLVYRWEHKEYFESIGYKNVPLIQEDKKTYICAKCWTMYYNHTRRGVPRPRPRKTPSFECVLSHLNPDRIHDTSESYRRLVYKEKYQKYFQDYYGLHQVPIYNNTGQYMCSRCYDEWYRSSGKRKVSAVTVSDTVKKSKQDE